MPEDEDATPGFTDLCAWTGHWAGLPRQTDSEDVLASLAAVGVARVCLSPLDGVWALNPHLANDAIYRLAKQSPQVYPVPLLDPTLPTWREEIERAQAVPRLRLVRLAPAYSGYDLEAADELLAALETAGLGAAVQVRIEDPRRQHPRAQVPDVPVASVVAAARRYPEVPLVLAGASARGVEEVLPALGELPRLYADTAQVDGMDGVRRLVDAGAGQRLLFASHAPLFMPQAAVVRVLADFDDAEAWALLAGNAAGLLG